MRDRLRRGRRFCSFDPTRLRGVWLQGGATGPELDCSQDTKKRSWRTGRSGSMTLLAKYAWFAAKWFDLGPHGCSSLECPVHQQLFKDFAHLQCCIRSHIEGPKVLDLEL